ncbi:hypothetical protein EZV62_023079 [Acer yangbiense]|uniref:Uncharacterized protein n=1 Tax=Acer yangbiense TaxID=1000413 RepID=A0A5C7H1B7_9ROSI|nr:hypothetical protein EZV62_023079 [Acer yangbiense]
MFSSQRNGCSPHEILQPNTSTDGEHSPAAQHSGTGVDTNTDVSTSAAPVLPSQIHPITAAPQDSLHHMTTRSKNGIFRPKALVSTCHLPSAFLTDLEPKSVKLAMSDPRWLDTNSTLAGCKPLPLKPLFCTGLVTYMKNESGPNQMKDTYPLSNMIVPDFQELVRNAFPDSDKTYMRGIAALIPAKHRLKQIYTITESWGKLATSTPKKHVNNDSTEGVPITKVKAEPIVAYSKPPPLPPVIGPLVALSLLETLSSRNGDDD